MHELAVTEAIVNVALKYAERNNARKVVGVRLRIGEMSHIIEHMLVGMFQHLSSGTIMEGAAVSIEWTPVILRCVDCDNSYQVKVRELAGSSCPACGGNNFTIVSGREFYVESIEVI